MLRTLIRRRLQVAHPVRDFECAFLFRAIGIGQLHQKLRTVYEEKVVERLCGRQQCKRETKNEIRWSYGPKQVDANPICEPRLNRRTNPSIPATSPKHHNNNLKMHALVSFK